MKWCAVDTEKNVEFFLHFLVFMIHTLTAYVTAEIPVWTYATISLYVSDLVVL